MAEVIGPMTALDAVNEILGSIGEAPIESIADEDALGADSLTALRYLYAKSRDLQEEGYYFNTENTVTITRDGNDKLPMPADALRVDGEGSINVVQRGGFLWNVDDNTFVFEDDMDCTVIRHLAWDDLPQYARRYITALAMVKFHVAFPPPTPELAADARTEFIAAKAAFDAAEGDDADYNVLTNSSSVSGALRRGT